MATDKFVLDDSMAVGWEYTRKKFWPFLGMLGLSAFIVLLPQVGEFGAAFIKDNSSAFMLLTMGLKVSSGLLTLFMGMGIINIQLRIINDLPFNSNDLWKPISKFWAYLGVSILYALMVCFGVLFFIVPGIILAITFMFAPYFLVYNRCGPLQALKASAAITEGAKWELFFLMLVLGIIEGLSWVFGFITFFITAILGTMFAKLTITYVFMQLINKTPDSELPFAVARSGADVGTAGDAPSSAGAPGGDVRSSDVPHSDVPHSDPPGGTPMQPGEPLSPGEPPTPKF